MVDTVDLYVEVWKELLSGHHVSIDKSFFKQHIDGNNDAMVVRKLMPSLSVEGLSTLKDKLFIRLTCSMIR